MKQKLLKSLMLIAVLLTNSFTFAQDNNKDTFISEITPGQEIDLGLSVNWAGWNIGANSPEQFGGYYAWGETEEKNDYTLNTYQHFCDVDGDGNREYKNIGNNISGTKYDVATVKWGNEWRMPTKLEFDELLEKCSLKDYRYKGVKGLKVIGPNGNSIFIPYAGTNGNSEFVKAISKSIHANLWTGTLDRSCGYILTYEDTIFITIEQPELFLGCSVRAVKNKR